jgi:site-specific DNA-cytosine methylase
VDRLLDGSRLDPRQLSLNYLVERGQAPATPPHVRSPKNAFANGVPEEFAESELDDCRWSASVALDPKHRPQSWDEPSGTVRREWCRYPQEAHLLDESRWRYRRLTVDEIALLQGFEPSWFDIPGMSARNRIRAIGDAVPPPLARAVVSAIDSMWRWRNRTAVEICGGAGGLGSGAALVQGMEHLLLVDKWDVACQILRTHKPWSSERVKCAEVKDFNFVPLRHAIGLLSGGPPCQPWSVSGRRKGIDDPRDLLAWIHTLVGTVEPEVFVFENVPGLVSEDNSEYLSMILERLRQPTQLTTRYGVMAGILDAADYGVAQNRRRVFILGFKNQSAAFAHRVFDKIYASATHRDPSVPHPSKARWLTVGQVLGLRPDPGGWRKWLRTGQSPNGGGRSE